MKKTIPELNASAAPCALGPKKRGVNLYKIAERWSKSNPNALAPRNRKQRGLKS